MQDTFSLTLFEMMLFWLTTSNNSNTRTSIHTVVHQQIIFENAKKGRPKIFHRLI